MADHLGSYNTSSTRTTVRFSFTTHSASGAAVAPSSAFENSDLRIYKDGSATQRSSSNGVTMTSPFDSVTGLHHVDIDLTDNTDAGFYAAGSFYEVHLVPDETVDSLAVVRVLAYFEIGRPQVDVREWVGVAPLALSSQQVQAIVPDTQKVDLNTIKTQAVTCAGGVTVPAATLASTANITAGTITTVTNLTNAPTAGDFTSTMKTSMGTAVAASAVASVTGNVGGNVAGSVGSLATQAKADVNAEADAALADAGVTTTVTGRIDAAITSRLASASYTAPDNSGIATAASAAASAATTASTINAKVGTPSSTVSADIAAVHAKTTNLPASPAAVGSAMTLADGAITDAKITLPTEAAGTPSTALQLLMWIAGMLGWRKVIKDSSGGTIKQYMSDGSTVKTTSAFTTVATTDTLEKAS